MTFHTCDLLRDLVTHARQAGMAAQRVITLEEQLVVAEADEKEATEVTQELLLRATALLGCNLAKDPQ